MGTLFWTSLVACGSAPTLPPPPPPAPAPIEQRVETPQPPAAAATPPEPEPAPEPAVTIPPSVDPSTLPEYARPLATLGGELQAAGLAWLARSRPSPREGATGTSARDHNGTIVCLEPEAAETRCVAIDVEASGAPVSDSAARAQLFVEGGYLIVRFDASGAAITRRHHTTANREEDGPTPRPIDPPAWLDALRGLEVVKFTDRLVARARDYVTFCELESYACTPPIAVEALSDDAVVVDAEFWDDMWHVGYLEEVQEGDVFRSVNGSVFVAMDQPGPRVVFSLITDFEQRSRVALERDDIDVIEVHHWGTTLSDKRCISIGEPSHSRTIELAGGGERQARSRLRRAPNTIAGTSGPSAPESTDLRGDWIVREGVGLVRTRSCDDLLEQ
jgi:hypothetical protein